ncbi:MAG: hypothetical protein GEU80_03150 [Dehalococcoidia bacterium]|nr:hypothetical protein [Dehalococcoidia bacterium]
MRPITLIALALVASAALIACDGADSADSTGTPTVAPPSTVTSTPEPTETATDAPTGTPATSTATPEPTNSPTPGADDRRTGVAELDAAIDAIVADDADAVTELIELRTFPCTAAQGAGGGPRCESGEADGAQVEAFPYGSCEVEFPRDPRQVAERFLMEVDGEPYAVTESPEGTGELFGYGQYMVVFELTTADGGMAAFIGDGGRIVHVASLCLTPPEDFLDWRGEQDLEVILPPPASTTVGAESDPIY